MAAVHVQVFVKHFEKSYEQFPISSHSFKKTDGANTENQGRVKETIKISKPIIIHHSICYLVPVTQVRQNNSLNPFPNKPWFLRVCSTSLLKTLSEKKKLLVTSNFFFFFPPVFSYTFRELSAIFIRFKIVVCKVFQFGRVRSLSFGKG